MTGVQMEKGARGQRSGRNLDEELLSLLERLSLQISAREQLPRNHRCNCDRRSSSRRSSKGPARASSVPSGSRPVTRGKAKTKLEPTATWVPSEVPVEKATKASKTKTPAKSVPMKSGAEKSVRKNAGRSLEEKTPSPRPPRALGSSMSVPQLRATVEVRPRRRTAAPKSASRRTPPPPELPEKVPESKLGRRSSRNLLAELAAPSAAGPALWEPVTAFEPPPRKTPLVPKVQEPVESAREIFYGSPEKAGETCHNCGRTLTEDSIYCRHCGAKRLASMKEGPNLSAVRFTKAPTAPTTAPTTAPPTEPLNLDSATRQLEQLVQETHQALVRDGIINGESGNVPSATPNLDAVDRALEELQRGLLEIDHVLAKPMPDAPV